MAIDCGEPRVEGATARHVNELSMVSNRYDVNNKARCVFKDPKRNIASTVVLPRHLEAFCRLSERAKLDAWRENLDKYLGPAGDPGARGEQQGRRFDLSPHQIRIKTQANDTELPNLAFDFEKREISFEWAAMFDTFYSERALLKKRKRDIKPGPSHRALRKNIAKEVRRARIKKWYLENHGVEFKDSQFEAEAENAALDAIEMYELCGDFRDCAEDSNAYWLAALML
jgi:hypothetical protein